MPQRRIQVRYVTVTKMRGYSCAAEVPVVSVATTSARESASPTKPQYPTMRPSPAPVVPCNPSPPPFRRGHQGFQNKTDRAVCRYVRAVSFLPGSLPCHPLSGYKEGCGHPCVSASVRGGGVRRARLYERPRSLTHRPQRLDERRRFSSTSRLKSNWRWRCSRTRSNASGCDSVQAAIEDRAPRAIDRLRRWLLRSWVFIATIPARSVFRDSRAT